MTLTLCLRKVKDVVPVFGQGFSVSLAGPEGGRFVIDDSGLGPWRPDENSEIMGLRESIESRCSFHGFCGEELSVLDRRLEWRAIILARSFSRADGQAMPCPSGPFCALGPNGNGDMAIENPFVQEKFFLTWFNAKLNPGDQIVAIDDSRYQPPKITEILGGEIKK